MVRHQTYAVHGEVCVYGAVGNHRQAVSGAWYFVSVDEKQSAEIKRQYGNASRGFGSLPVTVTIGKTTWKTSIFPDKKSGTYVLPLKALVRRAEGVEAGQVVTATVEL